MGLGYSKEKTKVLFLFINRIGEDYSFISRDDMYCFRECFVEEMPSIIIEVYKKACDKVGSKYDFNDIIYGIVTEEAVLQRLKELKTFEEFRDICNSGLYVYSNIDDILKELVKIDA